MAKESAEDSPTKESPVEDCSTGKSLTSGPSRITKDDYAKFGMSDSSDNDEGNDHQTIEILSSDDEVTLSDQPSKKQAREFVGRKRVRSTLVDSSLQNSSQAVTHRSPSRSSVVSEFASTTPERVNARSRKLNELSTPSSRIFSDSPKGHNNIPSVIGTNDTKRNSDQSDESDVTATTEELKSKCWKCLVNLRVDKNDTRSGFNDESEWMCCYAMHTHPLFQVPICCVCSREVSRRVEESGSESDFCVGCGEDEDCFDFLLLCDRCDRAICPTCVSKGTVDDRF